MGSCLIYINNLISAAAAIGFCFRSPGLRKAAWPAPAGIIKALPVSVAEAFAVCLAPGACTDVTASAAIAVIAASTSAVSTTTAIIAAVIIAAVIIAAAIVAASAAKTAAAKTTTITSTTTSTSKSKATHISHSPFLLVCTISYGTRRQSVTVFLS